MGWSLYLTLLWLVSMTEGGGEGGGEANPFECARGGAPKAVPAYLESLSASVYALSPWKDLSTSTISPAGRL